MKRIFKKILIAVDQGEWSARAASVGYSMAKKMGAEVLLVHVVNCPTAQNEMPKASRAKMFAGRKRRGRLLLKRMHIAGGANLNISELLREGNPAKEILAVAADWGAQLIIIGAYSETCLGNLLLGITTDTVARCAVCPVVTVGAGAGQ